MNDHKTITQNLVAVMEKPHRSVCFSAGAMMIEDFILTTHFCFKVLINNKIN